MLCTQGTPKNVRLEGEKELGVCTAQQPSHGVETQRRCDWRRIQETRQWLSGVTRPNISVKILRVAERFSILAFLPLFEG